VSGADEFAEPLEHRTNRVLESMMLGIPVTEHFLTLPNGMTLTIPDGKDSWDVFTPHALTAIGEGICPWCTSPLSERRECLDERHRPCRWHGCATGWGQHFLDVPPHSSAGRCVECGEVM